MDHRNRTSEDQLKGRAGGCRTEREMMGIAYRSSDFAIEQDLMVTTADYWLVVVADWTANGSVLVGSFVD